MYASHELEVDTTQASGFPDACVACGCNFESSRIVYVFIATKFFKFKMVKDSVQSLKAENGKLKEKEEEVFAELKEVQENLKGNRAGGHVASASDSDALKSSDFLSKEYDDLNKLRDRALDKISTLEKSLKQLSTEVSKVSMAID